MDKNTNEIEGVVLNAKENYFGIKDHFMKVWVKHSNSYGNGHFEYEYDIWCDKCYLLLDGLREKYDNVEVVVAHLSYGEFMNAEEFKEYADEVEKYSIKVCECDDCGEIKKTRFQIEIENDVKRLNEIYEKVERITPSNMDKMGGRNVEV